MSIQCKAAGPRHYANTRRVIRPKKSRKPRFKHPNSKARVLCKHDNFIFYDDHTFRSPYDETVRQWDVVPFPRANHNVMFFRDDEEDYWTTDYDSNNEEEVELGEALARALVNHEMKKVLTGGYDGNEQGQKPKNKIELTLYFESKVERDNWTSWYLNSGEQNSNAYTKAWSSTWMHLESPDEACPKCFYYDPELLTDLWEDPEHEKLKTKCTNCEHIFSVKNPYYKP